jgi:VIT1/CCC1 family predicted Fe2+/Mn2+ transporter
MRNQLLKKYLPEFTYWWIDGAVTTFAVVAGSIGANLDSNIILILWFANLFADGFAMSVWAYLSSWTKDVQTSKIERLYIANATFIAFIVLGFIPLLIYVLQYLWVEFSNPFLYASILTFISFAIIWYAKSFITKTSYLKNIWETLLLGASAAVVAYYVWDIIESIL